jgi:hypothetical protein
MGGDSHFLSFVKARRKMQQQKKIRVRKPDIAIRAPHKHQSRDIMRIRDQTNSKQDHERRPNHLKA